MATVHYKSSGKRTLTDAEVMMLERAAKIPIVYDEDCPELTPEMERALIEARRRNPYRGPVPADILEGDGVEQVVTISISNEALEKAKTLSNDYLAFLGRLLSQAVINYPVHDEGQ